MQVVASIWLGIPRFFFFGFFFQLLDSSLQVSVLHHHSGGHLNPIHILHNKSFSGNADIAILQPIYDSDQVMMLSAMYNGGLDRNLWQQMMNEIVKDELLPGSTPLEAKKQVRTLFVSDFENTKNPQIKFHYYEAEDPGKFKLCHPDYWRESTEFMNSGSHAVEEIDPVEELEQVTSAFNNIF